MCWCGCADSFTSQMRATLRGAATARSKGIFIYRSYAEGCNDFGPPIARCLAGLGQLHPQRSMDPPLKIRKTKTAQDVTMAGRNEKVVGECKKKHTRFANRSVCSLCSLISCRGNGLCVHCPVLLPWHVFGSAPGCGFNVGRAVFWCGWALGVGLGVLPREDARKCKRLPPTCCPQLHLFLAWAFVHFDSTLRITPAVDHRCPLLLCATVCPFSAA